MKKRAISLILCLFLLLSLSMSAMAINETTGSTTITKTIEDAPGEPGGGGNNDTPPTTSSYEVSIPASFSLDDGREFAITASNLNLAPQQELHVLVDYDRTFLGEEYFYLKNTKNVIQTMPCTICRYNIPGAYWEIITGSENALVAIFDNSYSPTADQFDSIRLTIMDWQTIPGTYTATIYFTMEIVDR